MQSLFGVVFVGDVEKNKNHQKARQKVNIKIVGPQLNTVILPWVYCSSLFRLCGIWRGDFA